MLARNLIRPVSHVTNKKLVDLSKRNLSTLNKDSLFTIKKRIMDSSVVESYSSNIHNFALSGGIIGSFMCGLHFGFKTKYNSGPLPYFTNVLSGMCIGAFSGAIAGVVWPITIPTMIGYTLYTTKDSE